MTLTQTRQMRKIKSFVPYFQISYVLEIAAALITEADACCCTFFIYIYRRNASVFELLEAVKHFWIVGMFKIKVVKDGLVIMIAGNLSIDGNKQN